MTTTNAAPPKSQMVIPTLTRPVVPTTPSRMTLGNITAGRKMGDPIRLCLYGPEGVGKTMFAASAPKPIILGAEDGARHLDVARFPKLERYSEFYEATGLLRNEKHDYQTFVLDTADWMEQFIFEFIVKRDKQKNIEGYGYGKGYTAAVDEWVLMLKELERLQASTKMNVIILAHSHLKKFANPQGEDFDRYSMKMNEKAAGKLKEWCDALLFANFETYAKADTKTKRVRGVATGARYLYTTRCGAYEAKNRYGLPDELPLSWVDFAEAVARGQEASPEDLRSEISRKAEELGDEKVSSSLPGLISKAGDNVQSLVIINNRVNALLAAKQAAQTVAPEAAEAVES